MKPRYLTVDGMLSGTGIRDSVAGGYIEPLKLGLPKSFVERVEQWLRRYENAHYTGFEDKTDCTVLDREGISISVELQEKLPQSKVEYYSHFLAAKLPISTPELPPL